MKIVSMKIVSYIFTVIIFGFIIYYFTHNWKSINSIPWWDNPGFVGIHIILLILTFVLFVIGWHKLLIVTGNNVSVKISCLSWLIPNIGKYIPGKVFMFAGRIALLNRFGIRKSSAAGYVIWENIILILAAIPFSLLVLLNNTGIFSCNSIVVTLLFILLLLLVVLYPAIIQRLINMVLGVFKKAPLEIALNRKIILHLLIYYLLTWIFYGLSGVSLAYALEIGDKVPMFLLFNVYIFSWFIGFISMITPGGIGVREGVLVLMISTYVSMSEVMVFAVLARMTWMVVELSGVIIGVILGKKLNTHGA